MTQKVLIAVHSCVDHTLKGYNQTLRDTWLKDTDVEHRFFIGNGAPIVEDTTALCLEWAKASTSNTSKPFVDPDLSQCVLEADEELLGISDKYLYAGYKMREMCRWALDKGFEFIFTCFPDTYVVPERLIASGFENHDYLGFLNGPNAAAICGGPGLWFSKKAMLLLVDSPVTHWASDQWAGEVMRKHGIHFQGDDRYTHLRFHAPPSKDNAAITSHIALSPDVYRPEQMVELYRKYKS